MINRELYRQFNNLNSSNIRLGDLGIHGLGQHENAIVKERVHQIKYWNYSKCKCCDRRVAYQKHDLYFMVNPLDIFSAHASVIESWWLCLEVDENTGKPIYNQLHTCRGEVKWPLP
jgi:hypothetical protein